MEKEGDKNVVSASEQNEKNKLEAMDFADKIYKVVMDPRFIEQVPDPNIRHKLLVDKYPNFAQAYPVVLRWLARDLKYKKEAFKQFLDKLEKDPGKGMEGFMERQADYARFLYISWHKGKHPNMKAANRLWKIEYENMNKWHKKLLEEEKSARNEFEEEEAENLEKKRTELLDFVNNLDISEEASSAFEPMDTFHEDVERMKYGLPLKNPNPSFDDLDVDKLSKEELCLILREVKSHENDLIAEIKKRDEILIKMEEEMHELRKFKEEFSKPKEFRKKEVLWDESWLEGTSVALPKGRKKKTQKNKKNVK
jgi:hypothetical protein